MLRLSRARFRESAKTISMAKQRIADAVRTHTDGGGRMGSIAKNGCGYKEVLDTEIELRIVFKRVAGADGGRARR